MHYNHLSYDNQTMSDWASVLINLDNDHIQGSSIGKYPTNTGITWIQTLTWSFSSQYFIHCIIGTLGLSDVIGVGFQKKKSEHNRVWIVKKVAPIHEINRFF